MALAQRQWQRWGRFLPAIAGVLVVVAGVGAIAHWAMGRSGGSGAGMPLGSQAIPSNALATLSLSTDPDQWQQLRTFGTDSTQASFDQQLARWLDRWLTQYGLTFDTHLQPWVGPEITVIWLPRGEAGATLPPGEVLPEDYQRLILIPIGDSEAAQALRDDPALAPDPEGSEEEERNYRGITLTPYGQSPAGAEPALWLAVLGSEFVAVSPEPEAVERAIDAYRGADSLGAIPAYRQSFDIAAQSQPFSKIYVNVPAGVQWLAQNSQPPLPPAVVGGFQDSEGMVATVTLASQGLQIQASSWMSRDSDRRYDASRPLPAQVAEYLPPNTVMMASGANFQQFWQDLNQDGSWGSLTPLSPEAIAVAIQGATGLVLEEDLLPWMGGEFALALVPATTPSASTGTETDAAGSPETDITAELPNPGLVLMAQASDRPLAEKTFSQLDRVLADRYRFQVKQRQVEDLALTDWVSPFEGISLTHGWLTPNLTFLAVGEATAAAIAPQPSRTLANQALFQLVTGQAPQVNHGHFYLNLAAINRGEETLFLPQISPENQGTLAAMEGIGVTTTVLDERRLRYDLFVALKQGNRPGPLPAPTPEDPE